MMYASIGSRPDLKLCDGARASRLTFTLLALLAIAVPDHGRAQQGPVLTLGEAQDIALVSEPGQRALRARARAREASAVAVGELPAPTLRAGVNNFPIESGGFSTEGMTNAGITFRQSMPRGKTRELSTALHKRQALSLDQGADARSRDVGQWVSEAWLDVFYWSRVEELLTTSRPFFEDLVDTTRSLYSVGRKSQQDVLRSELELSRLDDRLIDVSRAEAQARAGLARWIDDAAYRSLPSSLPAIESLPSLQELEENLAAHPALKAADASVAAADIATQLAEQKSKPSWAVDVGYSYRDGSLPSGNPRSDFVTLGVTVDLPFFRKRSVDSDLLAAVSNRSAEQAEREHLRRQLRSTLASEHARFTDLSRRLELYGNRILEQSGASAEAAMLAYQSDTADFSDVMRAYIDELDTRVEFVRLEVERARSRASITNLGGE